MNPSWLFFKGLPLVTESHGLPNRICDIMSFDTKAQICGQSAQH